MSKKVLMATSNFFTSVLQVGSHHYARAFEKLGYEVLYISHPITPFHKFTKNNEELKERERIYAAGGKKVGNIIYYVPKSLIAPYKKFPFSTNFVMNNWFYFTFPNIVKYIKKLGFDNVDILWFDNSTFWFLLNYIDYKKSILRLADYSRGFDNISESKFLKELYIAQKADLIVYTAKNIIKKYGFSKEILSKSLYVPNGIDWNFFEKADKSLPKEFKIIPSPRIIYIGSIENWFDTDLLYYSAVRLPKFNFIIIGPERKNLDKLRKLKNIYILGSKPHKEIPKYLHHSDAGIIPFDIKNYKELIDSVNPIKLYEYMACGLPVVSVEWEELKNINSPAYLSKTKEDFVKNVILALKEKEKRKKEFIEFAKKNDWKEKLIKILTHLKLN